jgi:transcriptional regulator with XRE-family HTH domain
MSLTVKFGENVRAIRIEQKLSQEGLAELCGLHRTYISGVERGVRNPTLSIIIAIAKALQVEPSALLDAKVPDGDE